VGKGVPADLACEQKIILYRGTPFIQPDINPPKIIKGTVDVISNDSPFKAGPGRFMMKINFFSPRKECWGFLQQRQRGKSFIYLFKQMQNDV